MHFKPFILNSSNDEEFTLFLDQLAKRIESILGYHYPFYRKMLERIGVGEPLYIGLRNEKGEMVAALPGFIKTASIGTIYSSLPFFGPNAGIICDYDCYNLEEIHSQTFGFLLKHLENYDMITASIYTPFKREELNDIYDKILLDSDSITVEKFTNYISMGTFKLDPSIAYDVRKAEKSGVTIRENIEPEDMEEIFKIYSKNCIDYGIPPKPKDCVKYLIEEGKLNPNVKTYIALVDDKIIAALIMIYSSQTANYYLPCSLHEYRAMQPTTLLVNHAINESAGRSIKYWNWESSPSKESGVFKFKKKWGSIDGTYRIYIKMYREKEFLYALGKEKISELFPYFYVYPFDKLPVAEQKV